MMTSSNVLEGCYLKKIYVTVSKEDIVNSKRACSRSCAISVALNRAIGTEWYINLLESTHPALDRNALPPEVCSFIHRYHENWWSTSLWDCTHPVLGQIALPPKAQRFIKRFDSGWWPRWMLRPFEFEIEIQVNLNRYLPS